MDDALSVARARGNAIEFSLAGDLAPAILWDMQPQTLTDKPTPVSSTAPLMHVHKLSRSFYGVQALSDASFDVAQGTVTALIGPNGAGKTTAFNCISGVIPPQSGRVLFAGDEITGLTPDEINKHGVVRTFQIARGFPTLTVLETLLLHGADQPGERMLAALFAPGLAKTREAELIDRAHAIAKRLLLDHVLENLTDALSGGQKKLLEIGRALMAQPRMILLDEPVAGVNPTLAAEIAERIQQLNEEDGLTFLIVEHDTDIVARICNPVVVMAQGRTLMQGSFEDIASDPRVQDAYLGKRG
ncbi:MAG: ABC transporter ATP-binding protein [Pseudomonadota bacterium]